MEILEIEPGVYLSKDTRKSSDIIKHKEILLYRFMDSFYIEKENLEDLSPSEVENLCRARLKYPSLIGPANAKVKKIIENYVQIALPKKLFEIGAGKSPAIEKPPTETAYTTSDADSEAEYANEEKVLLFSANKCDLPYKDSSLDMAIAVFVFQFKIYKPQIEELYRCLKDDGLIIANVYRRKDASRINLETDFKTAGFNVSRIADPQNLCRDHEYWLIGKDSKTLAEKTQQFLATFRSEN